MRLLSVTRSAEWWDYKLPPLLAIGYATVLQSDTKLISIAPRLLLLLLSLVAGAVYVSIINDITDIEEDLASGKKNRVAGLSKKAQMLLPLLCVAIGFGCFLLLNPGFMSLMFYSMAWIVFSLYSIPPIRLKKRGIWGVFADACGSHLFPGCLMVSITQELTAQRLDLLWLITVGVFSFFYGLRGILWHQFFDKKNDIVAGIPTYATKITSEKFKKWEWFITGIELIAFTIMVSKMPCLFIAIAFVLYVGLICYRLFKLGVQLITIIAPEGKAFQIFMAEYYQVFWPLALLLTGGLKDWSSLVVLAIHILLFHRNFLIIVRDFYMMPRYLR